MPGQEFICHEGAVRALACCPLARTEPVYQLVGYLQTEPLEVFTPWVGAFAVKAPGIPEGEFENSPHQVLPVLSGFLVDFIVDPALIR